MSREQLTNSPEGSAPSHEDLVTTAYFSPENPFSAIREQSFKASSFPDRESLKACLADQRVLKLLAGSETWLVTSNPAALNTAPSTHLIATAPNPQNPNQTVVPFLQGLEGIHPGRYELIAPFTQDPHKISPAHLVLKESLSPGSNDPNKAQTLKEQLKKVAVTTIDEKQRLLFAQAVQRGAIYYLQERIPTSRQLESRSLAIIIKQLKTSAHGPFILVFSAPNSDLTLPHSTINQALVLNLPLDVLTQQDYQLTKVDPNLLTPNLEESLQLRPHLEIRRVNRKDVNSALIKALSSIETQMFSYPPDWTYQSSTPYHRLPYPFRTLPSQYFEPDTIRALLTNTPDDEVEKFVYFHQGQPVGYYVQITPKGFTNPKITQFTSANPKAFSGYDQDTFRYVANWVCRSDITISPKEIFLLLQFAAPPNLTYFAFDTVRQLGNSGFGLWLNLAGGIPLPTVETHSFVAAYCA